MIWIAGADRLKLESKTPGIGLALGKSVFGGVCIKAEIRHSIVSGDFAEKFSEFILPISNYSLQVNNKNISLTCWLYSKSKKKEKKKKNGTSSYGCAVLLGKYEDMQDIDLIFFCNFEHLIAWGLKPQYCTSILTKPFQFLMEHKIYFPMKSLIISSHWKISRDIQGNYYLLVNFWYIC